MVVACEFNNKERWGHDAFLYDVCSSFNLVEKVGVLVEQNAVFDGNIP